jgi:hypothetical protein
MAWVLLLVNLQVGFLNYNNNHFYFYIDLSKPGSTLPTCDPNFFSDRPSSRVLNYNNNYLYYYIDLV